VRLIRGDTPDQQRSIRVLLSNSGDRNEKESGKEEQATRHDCTSHWEKW